MKCVACGAEIGKEKVCVKCGKEAANTRDNLEVNYKDFKISEFLEIRSRRHEPSTEVVEPSGHGEGNTVFSGKMKRRLYLLIPLLLIIVFVLVYLIYHGRPW
jgi:hypothetical protein